MKNNTAFSRRQFLEFLGQTAFTATATSSLFTAVSGCTTSPTAPHSPNSDFLKKFMKPSDQDAFQTASDIQTRMMLKWGDSISTSGLKFGSNNDYCAFIPKDPGNPTDGILMVNHESLNALFVSGFDDTKGVSKTRAQVRMEQECVGISLLRFHKTAEGWQVDLNSPYNRRITARTRIPFLSQHPIEGSRSAQGTLANCAGGITPWGTFLTCEENYDQFYGEWDYSPEPGQKARRKKPKKNYITDDLLWYLHDEQPPTHFGWVVEIDPWTGKAHKLTSSGRFCHESATCIKARDQRTVVYMGDDTANQFLYKFISYKPNSLKTGTLYVAHMETGRWLPITMDSHPEFRERFLNETDLKVRTREAAALLGATPLDRPEDIEINPANGDVIVALSNNASQNRIHGSLLRIQEKGGDATSLSFTSSTWISGGPESGLSCPDNLAFDRSGNLWCTSDMSDEKMNTGPYQQFKNNGLYFIPVHGPAAGQVFQVASAPRDAELTGPMFTPDGETLLICVQHPGDQTTDLKNPTSHWPDGLGHNPKSALMALSGQGLRSLVNYKGV